MTALSSFDKADHLVILRSLGGPLTKRIGHGPSGWRTQSFSAGAWFSVHQRALGSFLDYSTLLDRVSGDPRSAIVRGRKLPHRPLALPSFDRPGRARRPVTFEPTAPSLARNSISTACRSRLPDFAAEPEAGVEHCWPAAGAVRRSVLLVAGDELGRHQARHPLPAVVLAGRPPSDAEAKGWLAGSPVDRSLYAPVTLHYTAAPILEPGTPDPVVRRSGIRQAHRYSRGAGRAAGGRDDRRMPVASTAELTEADLEALARRRCARPPRARSGRASGPFRTAAGHFALAAALARAGCRDPDTLHRALCLRPAARARHRQDPAPRLRQAHHRCGARSGEGPMTDIDQIMDRAVDRFAHETPRRSNGHAGPACVPDAPWPEPEDWPEPDMRLVESHRHQAPALPLEPIRRVLVSLDRGRGREQGRPGLRSHVAAGRRRHHDRERASGFAMARLGRTADHLAGQCRLAIVG